MRRLSSLLKGGCTRKWGISSSFKVKSIFILIKRANGAKKRRYRISPACAHWSNFWFRNANAAHWDCLFGDHSPSVASSKRGSIALLFSTAVSLALTVTLPTFFPASNSYPTLWNDEDDSDNSKPFGTSTLVTNGDGEGRVHDWWARTWMWMNASIPTWHCHYSKPLPSSYHWHFHALPKHFT